MNYLRTCVCGLVEVFSRKNLVFYTKVTGRIILYVVLPAVVITLLALAAEYYPDTMKKVGYTFYSLFFTFALVVYLHHKGKERIRREETAE